LSAGHHAKNVDLFDAILHLENAKECEKFFRDLCTHQELKALKERWRVCQLLENGDLSYRDIHAKTGVSLVTIGRIARFLNEDSHGGYRLVLQRLKK
jgi:TrpR-related protein YerC/YecD